MNRLRLSSLILLLTFFSGCWNPLDSAHTIHQDALHILDSNGHVRPQVTTIIQALGHANPPSRVDLFVKECFLLFARKKGVERWQVQDNLSPIDKNRVLAQFETLGFFDAITPKKSSYDYFVVLGASIKNVRTRLAYLKKLWVDGIRAKRIVFLTGARRLEPFEGPEQLNDRTQTTLPIKASWQPPAKHPEFETDLMRELWLQAELPTELAALPLDVINTPEQKWPDGSTHRPNTGDTAVAWLATKPTPGSCLCISVQPYVGYQGAVMRRLMPAPFTIETVGAAVQIAERQDPRSVSVLVDTLLRQLLFESFLCRFFDEQTLESYLKQ